ncbi:hypothetical protein [Mesorhizobium sp. WSM4313]|uniref:hypothetical protein n=1 Tax=Mesorhizobium sp. WSM4313 TaxID=2029412 RepID=UPI001FD956B7|nr:hypothetical protein [Mesorhizobium sp. WSM4313]
MCVETGFDADSRIVKAALDGLTGSLFAPKLDKAFVADVGGLDRVLFAQGVSCRQHADGSDLEDEVAGCRRVDCRHRHQADIELPARREFGDPYRRCRHERQSQLRMAPRERT